MINNRKKMQQIVAIVAIVGVAASGAITFFSVATQQQSTAVTQSSTDVNLGTQQTLPISPSSSAVQQTLPISPSAVSTSAPLAGQ